MEGGYIFVDLDVRDYEKGTEELKFSVVGRLMIQKGEIFPTTLMLKKKLDEAPTNQKSKIVPYKRGIYHILLHLMNDQASIMSQSVV